MLLLVGAEDSLLELEAAWNPPKLPKVEAALLLFEAMLEVGDVERALGAKDDAVGEAKSCSSSSATECMPPGPTEDVVAGAVELVEVVPKGLLPGKLLSALLECCDKRCSARWLSRRRWKKVAQNWRRSAPAGCLAISRSSALRSFM